MGNHVQSFLGKQFSEAYYRWLEGQIAKAEKNGDTIGLESLRHAKDLYFLDYMADWFEECATIAANMVTEGHPPESEKTP